MRKKQLRKRRSIRRKRSITENSIFSGFIFSIIVIALATYFFVFFPLFQVELIAIEETEGLNRESLEDYINSSIENRIYIFTTRSIFFVSPKKIEEKILEETLTVENIEIKKAFPATLVVETREREPVIYWCRDKEKESCFYTDKRGVVFKEAENLKRDFLFFTTYYNLPKNKKIADGKMIEIFFLIEKELKALNLQIDYIKISSPTKIKISLLNGFEIYLLREEVDSNLTKLKAFLDKKEIELDERLEYIDLRFEDRIYHK